MRVVLKERRMMIGYSSDMLTIDLILSSCPEQATCSLVLDIRQPLLLDLIRGTRTTLWSQSVIDTTSWLIMESPVLVYNLRTLGSSALLAVTLALCMTQAE
jgi:hypothetical protein